MLIKSDMFAAGGGGSYPLGCWVTNHSSYYGTAQPSYTLYWTSQKTSANEWLTASSSGWIVYKLDEAKAVKKVRFMNLVENASQTSRSVEIYGSNDGSNFTLLGSFTPDASVGSINEFDLSNSTSYLYYRINVSGASSYVGYGAVQFYE